MKTLSNLKKKKKNNYEDYIQLWPNLVYLKNKQKKLNKMKFRYSIIMRGPLFIFVPNTHVSVFVIVLSLDHFRIR